MSDAIDNSDEFLEMARLVPPIVKLWMLRYLVHRHALKDLIDGHGYEAELVLHTLIESWDEELAGGDDFLAYVQTHLREAKRVLECDPKAQVIPSPIAGNIERLSRSLNLDQTECQILAFAILLKTHFPFEAAIGGVRVQSSTTAHRVIAQVLRLSVTKVQFALSASGNLVQSGILRVVQGGFGSLESVLEFPSADFANAIQADHVDPLRLLADMIRKSAPSTLPLDAFSYLDPRLRAARLHLKAAMHSCRVGVNVLLYGPPGTGKTQLCRSLATALGCELYEVATEGVDGQAVQAESRWRAFTAAQRVLREQRSLLLFDEIEDIFPDPLVGRSYGSSPISKGAMNRLLEENPVPTIWVSNSIRGIDAAYVRRFDVVLEVPVPPRLVRERVARLALGDMVESSAILKIAESSQATPGVFTRAAEVMRSAGIGANDQQRNETLFGLINGTLQAQGHARIEMSDFELTTPAYDPRMVHADCDLQALADGIRQAGNARLCLFGPPGSGKTAYASWLAQQMDRRLLVQRASDLLSMWLGESEQNIARAFQDAQRQDCVLLIDEIDGLLLDRRGAAKSWEITQVNEMLTRIETFSGVFIATTNLMGRLDPAALRRFDLKARFDYLLPEQAWLMLQQCCEILGFPHPVDGDKERFNRLGKLTPGDFAAVVRRHRFHPLRHAAALITAIEAECAMKEGAQARIGFV